MKGQRDVLATHGTKLMTLQPGSLLQAAQADLRRRGKNAEIAKARNGPFLAEGYEHYAFHRSHVRKAADAHDLLVRALMDPGPGMASDKSNTRLIYGDAGLLLAAIHMGAQ